MSNSEIESLVAQRLWECQTYGTLEAAAGVTDREAFWRGKTEEQAKAALRQMAATKVRAALAKAKGAAP